MSRTVFARYAGKLASGKRVYVNAYAVSPVSAFVNKPLAFAIYVTRENGRTELVGRITAGDHEDDLKYNPESGCYERKPDGTPHVLTARECADEKAGWWNRHGHKLERAEVVELTLVRSRS